MKAFYGQLIFYKALCTTKYKIAKNQVSLRDLQFIVYIIFCGMPAEQGTKSS